MRLEFFFPNELPVEIETEDSHIAEIDVHVPPIGYGGFGREAVLEMNRTLWLSIVDGTLPDYTAGLEVQTEHRPFVV